MRAARRGTPTRATEVDEALASLNLHAIDDRVVAVARLVDPPSLRSLDAIHLATALILREAIGAFISYDRPLLSAAEAAGLPAVRPA